MMLHVAAQGSSRTGWFKPGYVQERRYLQVPKLSAAYQRQPTREDWRKARLCVEDSKG